MTGEPATWVCNHFSKWLSSILGSPGVSQLPTCIPKFPQRFPNCCCCGDIHPIFLLWCRDCYSNKREGEVGADIGNCARNCSPHCAVPDLNQRVTLDLIMPVGDFCACLDLGFCWLVGSLVWGIWFCFNLLFLLKSLICRKTWFRNRTRKRHVINYPKNKPWSWSQLCRNRKN